MIHDRSEVREGMTVFSSDGEKLGKVQSCDAGGFVVEKGFFFPTEYLARFDQIASVDGDEIRLGMTKEGFVSAMKSASSGWGANESSGSAITSAGTERSTTRRSGEDIRVPISEEQLDVVKHDREAGEVRLRKEVVHETKRVDVPVTREEVHVERVPVSERRDVVPGDKAFQQDTVSVPVHEEEIEVRKRPVVKEEVRLRKDRVTEQRAAEADVRSERVEIEGQDQQRTGGIPRSDDADLTRRQMGEPYRDDELP
jgi:uncharacterized protein (TIGR02271 family)